MKIARIDSQSVKVPYTFGGSHKGEGLRIWTTNNILLVRVETDTGIVAGLTTPFRASTGRASTLPMSAPDASTPFQMLATGRLFSKPASTFCAGGAGGAGVGVGGGVG